MKLLNFSSKKTKSILTSLVILTSLALKAQLNYITLVQPKIDTIIPRDSKLNCKSKFYFAEIVNTDSIKLIELNLEKKYSLNQFLVFDSIDFEKKYNYVINTLTFKKDQSTYNNLCFETRFLFCVNQITSFEGNKTKSEFLKKLFLSDVIKKGIYSANEEIDFVLTKVLISDTKLVLDFLNQVNNETKENLILNLVTNLESIDLNLEETKKQNLISSLQKVKNKNRL